MTALEISGISKKFGDRAVLDNISLSIADGEFFFLLGPSGCGKTTLLRIIAGLAQPDSGSLRFRDVDLLPLPPEKRNIGLVFQTYALWPHMTVFGNVAYGLKLKHMPSAEVSKRVADALKIVGLSGMETRKPGTLSGGEQQRVSLARALVLESSIVLLDEPLSNLDAKLRKEMRVEIKRIHQAVGKTFIYVTHDQEEAAAMADRMALMNEGHIIQVGTPKEVMEHPKGRFAEEFFGKA